MAEEEKATEEQQQAAESDAVHKKDGEGAAPAGPNPKLVFLVQMLNTVVLVVLAFIVWRTYMKDSQKVTLDQIAADDHATAEHGDAHGGEAEEGGEHGGGHGGEGKEAKAAGVQFIKESFTVNLADSQGAHFAKVDVEFELNDDFVKDELERLRPKVRDFITIVLSSKTMEQVESGDGKEFLREEIRNKVNGFLTRGQVSNVYFTQFIVN